MHLHLRIGGDAGSISFKPNPAKNHGCCECIIGDPVDVERACICIAHKQSREPAASSAFPLSGWDARVTFLNNKQSAMANMTKPRVRMIIPIWGADYIERWLAFSFASLRSQDNIFYLAAHTDFELVIMTRLADAVRMQADRLFENAIPNVRVKFVAIDELLPKEAPIHYGMPLTLAYAKGIMDLGADSIGTYVVLVNADFVLTVGSLRSLVERMQEGNDIIVAPSLRVVDGPARSLLEEHIDKSTRILSITSRAMMTIANAYLHNTVRARMVNDMNFIDTSYYHQIYWRTSENSFAARCFLIMPLCFRIERKIDRVVCPVDYGFITEMCPSGRFCVINDSDDFMMVELQSRDSEAELLRIAPPARTLNERVTALVPEIALHATSWTTAEHRRAAAVTLYFHEDDLPEDIDERVRPLATFMDQILARMPPPVSHLRHFHWLPDVRNYRHRMTALDGGIRTNLLDDEHNSLRPRLAELYNKTPQAGGLVRRLCRYCCEELFLLSARPRYRLRQARKARA